MKLDSSMIGVATPSGCGIPSGKKPVFQRVRNGGAAAIAATLYRYGPSREDARWTWITPGSLFTALGWLLLTSLFGFYIGRVTDYGAIYGSLGALMALLIFTYAAANVVVFGAEFAVEWARACDTRSSAPA
ncbi:MAG: YihY/virulence factor BrkB family protein [Actinobacteria bacterium]|nr:YihY/virulence factor BrkB family protein [Actinomycetota bacterium]